MCFHELHFLLHQLRQAADDCDCKPEQHERGQDVERIAPVPVNSSLERHV